MCYHKRYLFTTCGHSLLSPSVIAPCPTSQTSSQTFAPTSPPPEASRRSGRCRAQTHPYQTLRIDRLCPRCGAERERLLALEEERRAAGPWAWEEERAGTRMEMGKRVGVSVLRERLRERVVVAKFE